MTEEYYPSESLMRQKLKTELLESRKDAAPKLFDLEMIGILILTGEPLKTAYQLLLLREKSPNIGTQSMAAQPA